MYQFDAADSFLSESAKPFALPIQDALTKNDFSNLDRPIAQILKIAQTSTKILEIGEIYLLCARAYYAKAEMEIAKSEMQIAKSQTEIAKAKMEIAKAEQESAKAEKQKAKAEKEKAKAEIIKARAEMEKAKVEVGKTLQTLDEAGNLYKSDPHKYAVVQWMKGCTYWKMKNNQPEALQFWQLSLDTFERLKEQYRMDKQGAGWYQEQCDKMRQSFQQVNLEDRP